MADSDISLPSCALYHPLSELRNRPGYYPNLSPSQIQSIHEIKLRLTLENLDFFPENDKEDKHLKILRFLRARKFDLELTMSMIREDIKWRRVENRGNYVLLQIEQVVRLNCSLQALWSYYPTWLQGYDKQNRPISYRKFGNFETWNIAKIASLNSLVDFHIWESEQAVRILAEQSKITGYNIETFTVVIDASGFAFRMLTSDGFNFCKMLASADSDHYPERLGTLVVINAPMAVSVAWKVVSGFLDEATRVKIRIIGCDEKEWKSVLLDLVDADQLPIAYGGTAPNIDFESAIESMNPPLNTGGISYEASNDITSQSIVVAAAGGGLRSIDPSGVDIDVMPERRLSKVSTISEPAVPGDSNLASIDNSFEGVEPESATEPANDNEQPREVGIHELEQSVSEEEQIMPTTSNESVNFVAETQTEFPDNSATGTLTQAQLAAANTAAGRKSIVQYFLNILQCNTPMCTEGVDDTDFDYAMLPNTTLDVQDGVSINEQLTVVGEGLPVDDNIKKDNDRDGLTEDMDADSVNSDPLGPRPQLNDSNSAVVAALEVESTISDRDGAPLGRVPYALLSPLPQERTNGLNIYDIYGTVGSSTRERESGGGLDLVRYATSDNSSIVSGRSAGPRPPSVTSVPKSEKSATTGRVPVVSPYQSMHTDASVDKPMMAADTVKCAACSCVIS